MPERWTEPPAHPLGRSPAPAPAGPSCRRPTSPGARHPNQRARSSGQYGIGETDVVDRGALQVGVGSTPRPIDELVEHDQVTRCDGRLQRTAGTRPEHPAHSELPQGPQIGPGVDPVRGQVMLRAVPGQECDRPVTQTPDGHRPRYRPVRGVERHLGRIVQESVEARSSDYGDLRRGHGGA